jgi:hypothetical protein
MLAQHVLQVAGNSVLVTRSIEFIINEAGGKCNSTEIIASHLILYFS